MAFVVSLFRISSKKEMKIVKSESGDLPILHATVAEPKKSSLRKGKERETNFFDIVLFGRRAETFDELFDIGDPVYLQGEMENNNYTKDDGTQVYRNEIMVDDFRIVESKEQKKLRLKLTERRKAEEGELEDADAEGDYDEEEAPAKKKKAAPAKKAAAKKTAPAKKVAAKKKPEPEPEPEEDEEYDYDDDDDEFL